jgi:hypothetical protein
VQSLNHLWKVIVACSDHAPQATTHHLLLMSPLLWLSPLLSIPTQMVIPSELEATECSVTGWLHTIVVALGRRELNPELPTTSEPTSSDVGQPSDQLTAQLISTVVRFSNNYRCQRLLYHSSITIVVQRRSLSCCCHSDLIGANPDWFLSDHSLL